MGLSVRLLSTKMCTQPQVCGHQHTLSSRLSVHSSSLCQAWYLDSRTEMQNALLCAFQSTAHNSVQSRPCWKLAVEGLAELNNNKRKRHTILFYF